MYCNTKIIATIGPSTDTVSKIYTMVKSGMDVARLNFSHGSYEHMLKIINNIRTVSKKIGYSIPIIQDLQGPKIRVGMLPENGIKLIKNKVYTFASGTHYDGINIPIPINEIINEIKCNDYLFLADGILKIKVIEKINNGFKAKVIYGGILKSNKGIIAENRTFSLSSLTKKDYKDIDWGYENNIKFEYIAFSFVKSASDVNTLKEYIKKKYNDTNTKIIVKFETAQAVKNMEEIVKFADGIMIARGDLGLEVPIQYLPNIQKKLINICRKYKKPVIVATQMLSSMMTNPIPNRSEVSDIANAIYQKTDAIMLSDETAVGKNAIASVRMFNKIIHEVEKEQKKKRLHDLVFMQTHTSKDEISETAKSLLYIAQSIKAKHLIICSNTGYTASVFTSFRSFLPIIVITNKHITESQLRLYWGMNNILIQDDLYFKNDTLIKLLTRKFNYKKNDKIIFCNITQEQNIQQIISAKIIKF